MATWRDISVENEFAARELFTNRRYRSCVSRAYYAAYSRATGHLHGRGAKVHSRGRGNPSHDSLPNLVCDTVGQVPPFYRRLLKRSLERLYVSRITSDYLPGRTVDQGIARSALGDMTTALRVLEMSEVRQ